MQIQKWRRNPLLKIGLLMLLTVISVIYLYNQGQLDTVIRGFFNINCVSLNGTQKLNASQFVTIDDSVRDGRRLGNQLFSLAAVLFVAELTERKPVLKDMDNNSILLEQIFQLNLERVDSLCPCHIISESYHLAYDKNLEKQALNPKIASQCILVAGFRQSWKYSLTVDHRLRQHLIFKTEIQRFVENFLQLNIPPGWKKASYVRVGIHCRRGDNLLQYFKNYGYTVPNATYFEKAMKYFTDLYDRVQFIVLSDDFNWTRENIVSHNKSSASVNVTYSVGHSPGQDLALLSMCDHVILSTGTFGWWGAWLADGTTIYYGDWPRVGSPLYNQFKKEDFFPPHWISMTSN